MKTLLRIISLAAIMVQASAQTNVSGYILTNTTWTLANSPYIVTGNILVNNGVTLTIEPGVTVKFDTTKSLQIDGELIAIGTAQNRITFTATSSNPVKGSWGRIQFSPTSTDAVFDTAGNYVSGSILKYCDIRYGGGVPGDVTMYCDTAAPYFSHCRIEECLKHAVYFVRAVGRVDSSTIRNCGGTAVSYVNPVSAALIVMNDTIENNGGGISRNGTGSFANVTIQHCIFTHTGVAINVASFSNSNISNNVFTANTDAIQGSLGVNANISNNTFIANTNSVIGSSPCNGANSYTLSANNLTIANNYFEANNGAIIGSASYGIIDSNTFLNNRLISVCMHVDYVLVELFGIGLITNNVFDGNTYSTAYSGEYLVRANGKWEIAYNIVNNNHPGQFALQGQPTICNNKFINNSGYVIRSFNQTAGSFIHHNKFTNNSATGSVISVDNNSTINNNEFKGNSCSGSAPIVAINGAASTISNNRFLDNLNSGCPIIYGSNSNSNIHNNDLLNNSGLSGMRISGTTQPVVTQNNFVNPGLQYEIENQIPFGPGANINLSDNYWGTTNTAHIDSVIKDYFDDANLSVALYPPVLAAPAFVDTNASCTSVVCSLSISGTVVNVSCYGGSNGSINITVSNGTSPYTYVWSSGASSQNISSRTSGNYTVTVIDANFCSTTKSFTISQPSSPVAVVSGVVANANCNTGGSINIAAGGGTSPYTYNWGSGITTQNRTGLNPGNYSVTVMDNNNCSATQSFTVGQDAGPVISGTVTNTSCHNTCDGSINLSVTGIALFTYDWGNGFGTSEDTSGLCAGTYNVTVADSNNCGIAAAFTVTSPAALSAAASVTTHVSCFGYSDGAATAVATGGTPPYSFQWNSGQSTAAATGFSAGTYDVTATDSQGCTATASVTMPDGYRVFAGAIIGFSTGEVGQLALYSVNASFSYSYNWSVTNGIITSGHGTNSIEVAWTAAGTGLVEVIATERGCADTVSKTVTVVDTTQNCSALFYLYPDTIPHSYFIVNTASGITPLYYSWDWGDGSAVDTTAYPSHTYSAAGFYTICLTITDSAGCSDSYCHPYYLLKTGNESSAMIRVNVIPPAFTGIQDVLPESISLYPNPTNGTVTLKASGVHGQVTLKLFDAIGRQLLEQSAKSHEFARGVSVNLSQMNPGLYFLRIQSASDYQVIKVLKQ